MSKRKSYTAKFKLEVIAHAELNGNRKAGRTFGVDEKSIREWRSQKTKLKQLEPTRRACVRRTAKWPNLEKKLQKWVLSMKEEQKSVSTMAICSKARLMAKEMGLTDFIGSTNWAFRFMRRNDLAPHKISSPKLSSDKIENFQKSLVKIVKDNELDLWAIVNMDEITMSLDLPTNRLAENKAPGSILLTSRTNGNNLERVKFTIVLGCTASGEKLKPMVIFAGKSLIMEDFPNDIIVHCNEKGCMNTNAMKLWLFNCFNTRPNNEFPNKSLLIMDSRRGHNEEELKTEIESKGVFLKIIPEGLTSKLQPLNISVSVPFKTNIRNEYENWLFSGKHLFTKSGYQTKSDYILIAEWIVKAWSRISMKLIKVGFVKAKIISSEFEENYSENEDRICFSIESMLELSLSENSEFDEA